MKAVLLKNILTDFLGLFRSRIFILGIFFIFLGSILLLRLYNLQIVNGEDYLDTFTYRIQKNIESASPRGTIYDRNGVVLAYDERSYTVTIEDDPRLTDNQTRNEMVAALIGIVKKTNSQMIYDLPLEIDESGNMAFTEGENSILRFKKDVYATEDLSASMSNASAQEVFLYMRDKLFELGDGYDDQTALEILSVRFDIFMKRYAKYQSVAIVNKASDELIAAVRENGDILPGVTISQSYSRVYPDSIYFSDLTGYIGSISEDELTALEEKGNTNYSMNDNIGKTGIESYLEERLKGTKGSQTLYVNSLGSILETTDVVDPVRGEDVYLSIDADFTKKAYKMIEERIAGIILANLTDSDVDKDNNEQALIPVKDAYYSFIKNNIINLKHIKSDEASAGEKSFYSKYQTYVSSVMNSFPSIIQKKDAELEKASIAFISMANSMLQEEGVLNVSHDNSTYSAWSNGESSFSDLIRIAISDNMINLENLDLASEYVDSGEIYNAVLAYIQANLPDYEGFEKRAYYYMLDTGIISGEEICLLLYDQGVLEEDGDSDYEALASGSLGAYGFLYNKILNMEITPDMLALEPCSASFVMTDIKTGKVLCLISYPGYDANRIDDISYYSYLLSNEAVPLFNHATQQTIAPGSTFKPISATAGLEEKIITGDTYIYDEIEFPRVEPHPYCWNRGGHGSLNVAGAIENSCNYFFYELGWMMSTQHGEYNDNEGLGILQKYARLYGLDRVSGLELPETEPQISDYDAVRSAIGQGTHNYSAAELTRYVTAIATSGTLYDLTLIDRFADSEGNITEENKAEVIDNLNFSKDTWTLVHDGMYQVCNVSPYYTKMSGLGIDISGKSGSAQEAENEAEHSLFIGYAPSDNPQIAATLIVPNGYGSHNILDLYADLICEYYGIEVERNGNCDVVGNTKDGTASPKNPDLPRKANIPASSGTNSD